MAIPGYKILRKIGDGGMSTVYLAIQLSVGREVALKILSPELRTDPSFGDRFFREANIVGTLSHPNIISIYDVGKEGEHYYIAMDYLPGVSCSERIKAGDLSTKDILGIVKNIASALDYAHERGFIHCDVKPDNILFRHDGSAVLTDFGIATSTGGSKEPGIKSVAGTPHYMSPEQTQGKPIDGRSDLYSLGILFYEMLTGELPYKGKDAIALAVKHLTAPVPNMPNEHKVFQALINRMLAKKPGARLQCGKEVIDAITALEGGLGKEQGMSNTEPTALQAFSLLEALLATFAHVSKEMVLRFFSRFEVLTRLRLSRKHGLILKDIDRPDDIMEPSSETNNIGKTTNFESSATKANTLQFSTDLGEAIKNNQARKIISPAIIMLITFALISSSVVFIYNTKQTDMQELTGHTTSGKKSTNKGDNAKRIAERANTTTNETQKQAATSASKADQTEMVASKVGEKNKKNAVDSPTPEKPSLYSLTIETSPKNAKVRILNIKPKYRDGIKLASGKYHVSVKAKGYVPYSRWVNIKNKNSHKKINLEKMLELPGPGDIIRDVLPGRHKAPAVVIVAAGSFIMGDDSGNSASSPAHIVKIDRAFAIGVKEVSYAQYDLFAKETQRRLPADFNNDRSNHPVSDISWIDANAYTTWLSKKTGKHYRLPTEAEWEYAARAGTRGNFWWPEESAKNQANCRKGCDSPWVKVFSSSTAPVGSFKTNQFGLYDTAGNVAEWVEDCYHDNYNGAPENSQAWRDSSCKQYSVRGGSFKSADNEITSTSRSQAKPGKQHKTIGFRIVREL